MSGICGIVFRADAPKIESKDLVPMVRSLGAFKEETSRTVTWGTVGFGTVAFPGRMTGVAEIPARREPLGLAFHGTLYDLHALTSPAGRDTDPLDVLVRVCASQDIAFLEKLRGEFALAIWNGAERTLRLATDRFRVEPLFYYHDHEKLIFGSRMKAVLACAFLSDPKIDPEAIISVVGSSFIPTPRTIFHAIKKLPPGHMLTYRDGGVQTSPYWEIKFDNPSARSEAELTSELRTTLRQAIALRLGTESRRDRIGTFLSGGVDSSTVTGLLTGLTGGPVKSFSIGFAESQFNETEYARIAARAFASEHHEYIVTPGDTYDVIPHLLDSFDEPFANASAVPTYFCAKLARDHGVDVLYAGDGGDELFAGNERYASQRLFDYYYRIPRWFRENIVKPTIFNLADISKLSFFVKGKRYIQRASIPYPQRLTSYGLFNVLPLTELFDQAFLGSIRAGFDPYEEVHSLYANAPASSELDRQLYIDLKSAISDNDLFKVNRMVESAGISRYAFPFWIMSWQNLPQVYPRA
jgi:asparagine synthase (glutamine-hydrolysing)